MLLCGPGLTQVPMKHPKKGIFVSTRGGKQWVGFLCVIEF